MTNPVADIQFPPLPTPSPPWLRSIALLGVLLVCGIGISAIQRPKLHTLKQGSEMSSQQELERSQQFEQTRLQFLGQVPDFGFPNLLADWVFLGFLQYFGDLPARGKMGYSLSSQFFDVILNRDPYWTQAYFFLSSSTSLFAGKPEQTIAIINRHVDALSPQLPQDSHLIWRYKAIDELLFLGDSRSARQSFLTSAAWAKQHTNPTIQALGQQARQTADFLANNPDSRWAQISAWSMVLQNSRDDYTQKTAIQRIVALGGRIVTDEQGNMSIRFPLKDFEETFQRP